MRTSLFTPISRERLAELADTLEDQAASESEPDWRRVVTVGRELVRGGRARLRHARRRRLLRR